VIRALIGNRQREFSQSEWEQQEARVVALRRLIAQQQWRRYNMEMTAEEQMLADSQLENGFERIGIINFQQYTKYMMDNRHLGNHLHYADSGNAGPQLARLLGRFLIVVRTVGENDRRAQIFTPDGPIIVRSSLHITN
jgi:hypothetical protein